MKRDQIGKYIETGYDSKLYLTSSGYICYSDKEKWLGGIIQPKDYFKVLILILNGIITRIFNSPFHGGTQ